MSKQKASIGPNNIDSIMDVEKTILLRNLEKSKAMNVKLHPSNFKKVGQGEGAGKNDLIDQYERSINKAID